MKKQLIFITLGMVMLSMCNAYAQQAWPCITDEVMNEQFSKNPEQKIEFEKKQAQFQIDYEARLAKNLKNKTAATQYTVPVVFHVLHTAGLENVSDAVCVSALAQINSDFAATGADYNSIYADFRALYINSDIKFMLAKKDPNGNCTNGIEHIYSTKTNWLQSDLSYYNGITWDPTKYLNIIVVKQIVPTGTVVGNGIVIGYTRKPGQLPTGVSQDAIVYNYSFLNGLDARHMTHEIGHWLNLDHTFGNTNNPGVFCGSDGVSDTPDTKGNFGACPATSTNTNYICTSPDPLNPASYYQNIENFMDYSICSKNFTAGQSIRMQTALNSSISGRNNLWSSSNLAFTDVNGIANCAPIADFLSTTNTYTVCSGGALLMKDYSYNGTISNYAWVAGNGAVIASPNASQTSITFPSVGTVTVSLTVSNGIGSSTVTKSVTVLSGTAIIGGGINIESFETPGVIPTNWVVTNQGSGTTWAQTPLAGIDGTSSIYFDGTQSAAGNKAYLQMPLMDVVNNPSSVFKFKYAYARQSSTQADVFKVQGSKDCGGTWSDIFSPNAATMANNSGGVTNIPFAPTTSQWKTYNVTYNAPSWFNFQNSASVLVRFYFEEDPAAGFGNRMFLDAINVIDTLSVGINELTKSIRFNLSPNPTSGEATVKFSLSDATTISINVVDMLGKVVLPVTNTNYGSGEQSISINKNANLPKGIYFVNLTLNGAKMSRKLIIQ
jgi:hypothetical protein